MERSKLRNNSALSLQGSWLQFCVGMLVSLAGVSCHRPAGGARLEVEQDKFVILTPESAKTPQIHGPKVFGVRPGSPFIFQIPATGERPIEYSADNLPTGLELDRSSGRITGSLASVGRHSVTLRAQNALGVAERQLLIICGDRIALTPPMGWNSWNCWGGTVTQDKILRAGRALIANRLQDHGWTYVNIDDGWQGKRGGPLNAIQGNANFPDLQTLTQQLHELGLKVGIYSTPWRTSFLWHIGSSADRANGTYDWIDKGNCTELFQYRFQEERTVFDKFELLKPLSDRIKKSRRKRFTREMRSFGKFSFVRQDATQWVLWGFDYLKYDWTPNDFKHAKEISDVLVASGRDVVISLSNNAGDILPSDLVQFTNSSRTAGDLRDSWENVSEVGFSQDKWSSVSVPGHYNDPDMLVIGKIGWGQLRPTRLTSEEQYAHVSLWCLLAAPLLLGCNLEELDPFTIGLITNDEVLDVNQDSLCRQATQVAGRGDSVVYAKTMEDGSLAVGLFNRSEVATNVTVSWLELGIHGGHKVRDLWRQKDLGLFSNKFDAVVPRHGVVLVRVVPAESSVNR